MMIIALTAASSCSTWSAGEQVGESNSRDNRLHDTHGGAADHVRSAADQAWAAGAAIKHVFSNKDWCGHGSQAQIGWALRAEPDLENVDLTARFEQLLAEVRAGKIEIDADAAEDVYLLVGGLFSEHYTLLGYGDGNAQLFAQVGLPVRRLPGEGVIDTDTGTEANARAIIPQLLAYQDATHKVFLGGQSKGGDDVAGALAIMKKEMPGAFNKLKRRIVFVGMQMPYGGSPLVSDLNEGGKCEPLDNLVGGVVRGLFGTDEGFNSMSYTSRQAFIEKYPYPAEIKTISFVSTKVPAFPAPMWAPAQYMLRRYNTHGDGFVARDDAIIPGSALVVLEGVDHGESVIGFGSSTPMELTAALLLLAREL